MKKTLVVLLALMMVFAFATTAMAADEQYVPYNDIADQDQDIQTAIERLSILGALKGYDAEGTKYAPSQLITREEFATIGVRMAGLEDQVALYASMASAFKDIEEGRWSEGYVNCANANGIMIGRGNGVFDPKANVTMQEVATVLLRAVGYDDRLPGAWPSDYNTKAVNVGLTEYVDYIGPKAATRAEVAGLANEALDLWMVEYVGNDTAADLGHVMGWVDKDGYMYIEDATNEYDVNGRVSLLNKTFDAYTVAAQFDDGANNYSEAMGWGFVDFADWELEAFVNNVAGSYEFASVYGISKGQDVTDLGWQEATLTLYFADNEIAYVDLTSDIVRTDDSTVAYGPLAKGEYGEIWYDAAGDVYAAKDFSTFEGRNFGIVDSADAEDVIFKGTPAFTNLDLERADYAFYLMGEGFIDATDLAEGDVIYLATVLRGADALAIVFRPEAGALDKMNDDMVEIDGYEYGVLGTSLYSINQGASFNAYAWPEVSNFDWSEDISWVPAYAFVNFAYIADDIQHVDTGLIDSYQFGATSDRLDSTSNFRTVTGVNVLLAGDDEVTTFNFADELRESQAVNNYPMEGSLFSFQLNRDGEIIAFTTGHKWNVDCAADCDAQGANVVAEWNANGNLAIDADGTALDDVYTFADDAVIYLVENAAYPEPDTRYAIGSGQCLTADELAELGTFTATGIHIEKHNGAVIDTLYIVNLEQAADKAWNFGLFTGEYGYSNSLQAYYVTIGDEKVIISENEMDAMVQAVTSNNIAGGGLEAFDDVVALVAYYTEGGEIVDADLTYFVENAADVAGYATFVTTNNADLDYSIAAVNLESYDKNDVKLPLVTNGTPATLFANTLIAGYDFVAADMVDLDVLDNPVAAGPYDGVDLIVVYDDANQLYYILIDAN